MLQIRRTAAGRSRRSADRSVSRSCVDLVRNGSVIKSADEKLAVSVVLQSGSWNDWTWWLQTLKTAPKPTPRGSAVEYQRLTWMRSCAVSRTRNSGFDGAGWNPSAYSV